MPTWVESRLHEDVQRVMDLCVEQTCLTETFGEILLATRTVEAIPLQP
jgi:uncharacterized Fe-S cluster-containing radical SAM superfamily protein